MWRLHGQRGVLGDDDGEPGGGGDVAVQRFTWRGETIPGGTIISTEGILCGTGGNTCSATLLPTARCCSSVPVLIPVTPWQAGPTLALVWASAPSP